MTPPPDAAPSLPPGSIAASVKALGAMQPSPGFRDAASATIRLSRARGRAECDALALLFESNVSDDCRTLILDLLAAAGTPEAQVAMRRLLSLGVARRDSRTFVAFVQRLGFMERPDGATLRFLISVYAESRHEAPEVRAACAYALGAGTGRAHVWGLLEPAISASEVLRRDLLQATTPAEKSSLVTALGNAGLDTDVGVILRFVEDPDARVRNAAALALRKMHTPEARSALLLLLTGNDQNVAESALSALFEQSLTKDEIVRLAELVIGGRTAIVHDRRIVRLIVTQKLGSSSQSEVVEDAVHLLLSRIESQALRGSGSGEEGSNHLPQRSLERPAQRASGNELPGMLHLQRARRVPIPKTPLPYSAGYRMVSAGEDRVPETVNDMQSHSNLPPRHPSRTGAGTVAYGSASAVIKHLPPSGATVQTEDVEAHLRAGHAEPPARAPECRSAFIAASPIVPLAIIR